MAEDALDPIALATELLVVADRGGSVCLGRDDSLDATALQVRTDGIGIVGFVGQKRLGLLFGPVDQFVVGFAVRRFARREVEGDRSSSGITKSLL